MGRLEREAVTAEVAVAVSEALLGAGGRVGHEEVDAEDELADDWGLTLVGTSKKSLAIQR